VADVEVKTTAGELSALLLESELVKELRPLLNSQLRNRQELTVAFKKLNQDGYMTLEFRRIPKLMAEDLPLVAGVFRSKRQAKERVQQLAEEHNLCWYLCGLETSKPCFGYHLEKCQGACLNNESALKYNLRFQEAMLPEGFTTWPFPGAIVVYEENEVTGQMANHVFDKWCYLGNLDEMSTPDMETSLPRRQAGFTLGVSVNRDYVFDLDVYKILKRFLAQHPGRVKVVNRVV
jgi:DNA polymerase III subunit epsilon